MKIDFSKSLTDVQNGKALMEGDSVVTLGIVCATAVTTVQPDKPTPQSSVEAWRLGLRVANGGEQEVTPAEVAMMMSALSQLYRPAVAGQACSMLDPS